MGMGIHLQVNKARVNPLIQGSTLLLHKLGGGGHKLSSWLKARGVLSLNSAYMTELIQHTVHILHLPQLVPLSKSQLLSGLKVCLLVGCVCIKNFLRLHNHFGSLKIYLATIWSFKTFVGTNQFPKDLSGIKMVKIDVTCRTALMLQLTSLWITK